MPWEQESGRGLGSTAAIPGKPAFPRDQGLGIPTESGSSAVTSVFILRSFSLLCAHILSVRCCSPGMYFIQILSTFCGILLYLEDFSGCSALHRFVLTICTGAKFILSEKCVSTCVREMLSAVPSGLAI